MDRIWNLGNLKLTFNSSPTAVKLQIIDSTVGAISVIPILTML